MDYRDMTIWQLEQELRKIQLELISRGARIGKFSYGFVEDGDGNLMLGPITTTTPLI